MDLLHFLPSKEADKRDKMLSVEMIKIVFGSCLQLCFQSCLLFGYTKKSKTSQIISIISSSIIICKVGVDIIRFKRKTVQNEGKGENAKLNFLFLLEKMKILKIFLIYLPLMATSLVFNTGTLIMTVLVWEEYSVIFILASFFLNYLISLALPFNLIEKCEKKLGMKYKLDSQSNNIRTVAQKKVTEPRVRRGLWVSWTNMFFLSRPVEDSS